ncbi:hypothetical protein PHYC_01541 [Phycisphaerales bacterium]|nr:hypothetical protein PHYC_01541 [Phycisphaerales bacterium]
MLIASIMLSTWLSLIGDGCAASFDQPQATRAVKVEITVRAPDGTPLQGMVVHAISSVPPAIPDVTVTDEQGKSTRWVAANDEPTTVAIGANPLALSLIPEGDPIRTRLESLLSQYSWPAERRVTVAPGEATVSMEFAAIENVVVRGQITGTVNRDRCAVFPAGGMLVGAVKLDAENRFAVKVPKGKRSTVCVKDGPGFCKAIELSEAQTTVDIDLGDIALDTPVTSAPVRIELLDAKTQRGKDLRLAVGLTLVSDDGQTVLEYGLGFGTMIKVDGSGRAGPGIPPGGYFVAPVYLAAGGGEKLIRAIRAGRAAELTAANFPHMVAVEGQVTTYSFSTGSSWDLLKQIEPDW